MNNRLSNWVVNWLDSLNYSHESSVVITVFVLLLIAFLFSWTIDIILRKISIKIISTIAKKTESIWDDIMLEHRVFQRVIHLIPSFIMLFLGHIIFFLKPEWKEIYTMLVEITILIISITIITSLLYSVNDIYLTYPGSKNRPLKGYIQTIQIIVIFTGLITAISIILGQSLLIVVGGMGACGAILRFVLKDTILGFVAGIQISFNDMIRIGDWITISKSGVDGNVVDIALTTIKVQNWDLTISTVPSYSLISETFQNWRGMEESGARRVKRAIYINTSSIKFCDEKLMAKLSRIQLIKKYIRAKEDELKTYNLENNIDDSVLVNGIRQTNIGIFRAYLDAYLQSNTYIRQDLTVMVRQLQAGEHGLPIEIYFFSKIQAWQPYEVLQSDIFDHIFAIISEFELEIFQSPTGGDFKRIIQ